MVFPVYQTRNKLEDKCLIEPFETELDELDRTSSLRIEREIDVGLSYLDQLQYYRYIPEFPYRSPGK